jgi:lipopolysaccharide transport system ATP-binding protein
MSIAIKAENVSKIYQLGEFTTGTLSRDIERWWALKRGKEDPFIKVGELNDRTIRGGGNFVKSLNNISFEIPTGRAIGIIGKNGAGKSTLLKVLSRITSPTNGQIRIKGRVASLLEVGTGFHPELTGRENIYLNGAILGMRKKEISKKFDEIVDFAGVERYIDTPVKRYSSGMYVRLAFAVAANLESEILIVDEVLAVGDAEFQKKSLSKLDSINNQQNKTVLFVSHNTLLIQNLCQEAMLLENGSLIKYGKVDDVISAYLHDKSNNKSKWDGRVGDNNISLLKASINENSIKNEILTSEIIKIMIRLEVKSDIDVFDIGFIINSSFNYPLIRCIYNDYSDVKGIRSGVHDLFFEIPPYTLAPGMYGLTFLLGYPYIKKVETSAADLNFEVKAESEFGNRYFAENALNFNSIIRPNWFKGMKEVV